MSRVICIAGESGSGKTTSMRNLDPTKTYYIDCDKKGLSWKGWKKQYNSENKNFYMTDNASQVNRICKGVSDTRPEITTVIIDTMNGIMVGDELRRAGEKNFDKWTDLAQCVWFLVENAHCYRDDLTVIFTAHTQTERDESGYMWTRIKTSGRKLDKICIESKFTTVLFSKCVDGDYIFETRAKNSTCKSPMGAFETDTIENDIVKVIDALAEF